MFVTQNGEFHDVYEEDRYLYEVDRSLHEEEHNLYEVDRSLYEVDRNLIRSGHFILQSASIRLFLPFFLTMTISINYLMITIVFCFGKGRVI